MRLLQRWFVWAVCLSISPIVRADDLRGRSGQNVETHQMAESASADYIMEHPGRSNRPFSGIQAFLSSSPYARALSTPAAQHLEALRLVQQEGDLSKAEMEALIRSGQAPQVLEMSDDVVSEDMPRSPPGLNKCPYPRGEGPNDCDVRYPFRTADGTCNNLRHALWGGALRPLARFLEPDYGDGFNSPRMAKDEQPLPSARDVSLSIYEDVSHPSHVHTLMHMVYGQFLDHDVDKTAIYKLESSMGTLVDVTCGDDGCQTDGEENDECFPIPVSATDPDFAGMGCLTFVRSGDVIDDNCAGPRQQLNQITSPIDASTVYGSDVTLANNLRETGTGRLRSSQHPTQSGVRELLPVHDDPPCKDVDDVIKCFLAGDGRVNEHVGLSALHTMFFRAHNNFVEELRALNPQWDGERLYQEARRIVGAALQVITYREYLPVLVGPQLMDTYGLTLQDSGYFKGYDRNVQIDISNVFATAGFRFGHSQIGNLIRFTSQDYSTSIDTEFSNVFFRPAKNYQTDLPGGMGVDSVVLGMISQPAESSDRYFPKQVTAHLFAANPPHGPGTDLPALNTQRGRDHGIPGYNEWRVFAGLPKLQSFDDLSDVISSQEVIDKFSEIYDHVDDIDLFPAAMSEDHVPGGMVGPTFAFILAQQFRNLRVRDRFWHENKNSNLGFSKDQLQELRKITLARVICDTLDNVEDVQKFVLLQPLSVALDNMGSSGDVMDIMQLYGSDQNERRPCSDVMQMNLSAWAES